MSLEAKRHEVADRLFTGWPFGDEQEIVKAEDWSFTAFGEWRRKIWVRDLPADEADPPMAFDFAVMFVAESAGVRSVNIYFP
jgi:hypothetical protein